MKVSYPQIDQCPPGLDHGFGPATMKMIRQRFNEWARRTGNDDVGKFRVAKPKAERVRRPVKKLGDAPGFSVAEAAKRAGMLPATLSKDIGKGKIKATKLGHRTVRIDPKELTRYLKSKGTK